MKKRILFGLFLFYFTQPCQAIKLSGEVKMPVMGKILNDSSHYDEVKLLIQSDTLKAYAPIEGTVYYVGQLKGYGLTVIIKNAHRFSLVSNLDRATVAENQYILQKEAIGSVRYHDHITFIVKKLQRLNLDSIPPQEQTQYSIDFAKKFQDKIFDIVKNGENFLKKRLPSSSLNNNAEDNDRILNYENIVELLLTAGFPEKTIPTMYCIAKWESNLNPKALNFNKNNTVDVGLFQINSTWFKKCNVDIATLYDEKENTKCALTVLQNQGFPAWVSYNKNKHKAYCDF